MYWKDNTVTLGWKDFKDDRHGDVKEITKTMIELLKDFPKDKEVIELGSGQGRNLIAIAKLGYTNALGVECNKKNLQQATKDYGYCPATINMDAEEYMGYTTDEDIVITCSAAYLMGKTVLELINEKAQYYICVEPTEKTYFTPNDTKYKRYNYKDILTNMTLEKEINCKWDNYKGYLFRRKQ